MVEVQKSIPFLVIAGSFDCFGLLSNALILAYLCCNRVGSKLTTALMKNQFIFDGLTSGFALLSLLIPDDLLDQLGSLTVAFCHLWVSRAIFWFFVLLSETNLVCIAVDRIRAVAFSSTYRQHEKTTLALYYSFIFIYSFLFTLPSVFTVDFSAAHCVHLIANNSDFSATTYMYVYSYLWLIVGYLIPGLVMAGCYVKVVIAMRKIILKKLEHVGNALAGKGQPKSRQSTSGQSNLSSFSRSFIVTAIVMWSVFLITHAYHTMYTILCAHNIIEFQPASIQRRIGIFVTVLNSTLNPLIMVISSPPFRRGLWRFLRSCKPSLQNSNASDGCSMERGSRSISAQGNRKQTSTGAK